jgi:hypothetical protein
MLELNDNMVGLSGSLGGAEANGGWLRLRLRSANGLTQVQPTPVQA